MNATDIAGVFGIRFREKTGTEIDEMKLHKMLYLAQRESLIRTGKPIFTEAIHAWKYGPVVVEVRTAYRRHAIPERMTCDRSEDADVLDYIFNTYADKNSWSLSRLTHAEYSWQHAIASDPSGVENPVMTLADIAVDAHRVAERRMALRSLGLA